jgi:integrase
MNSEVDIESEMQVVAKEAVDLDGQFVPGIERTNIEDVSEFGDFEYYAWERYYNQGKSPTTISDFFSAVSSLERFLQQSNKFNCDPDDIGKRGAKGFKRWLIGEVEDDTAGSYISKLDNMAQFYLSDGYYAGNPFNGLSDTIETSSTRSKSSSFQTNERISVDDSRLREAIRSTHGSQKIVLLALLVKTGVRISEACNLDWEDVNIDHPLADDLLPEPRFELSDYPDTIYIDCDKTEETHGTRSSGNKRKVDTRIPIDDELKRLLLWHALVRERRFDGENPVFMSNNCPMNESSDRLGTATAWKRVVAVAKEYGWHESGRSELKNVTPHWFRAKFTSYMSTQLEAAANSPESDFDAEPRDVVKGLRGDVGDDVIEGYRLRERDFQEVIRARQFKIGLEGL